MCYYVICHVVFCRAEDGIRERDVTGVQTCALPISGIQLLRTFMAVEETSKDSLMWMLIIHVTFVVSGVLLALMDLLVEKAHAIKKGA